jgi:hypothetical protein
MHRSIVGLNTKRYRIPAEQDDDDACKMMIPQLLAEVRTEPVVPPADRLD